MSLTINIEVIIAIVGGEHAEILEDNLKIHEIEAYSIVTDERLGEYIKKDFPKINDLTTQLL